MSDQPKTSGFRSKPLFSIGGLVLMLVILVLVNVLFSVIDIRWDTTHHNLYSLSDGSKKIISGLAEDTEIKIYYSEDQENLPIYMKNYAQRVIDFLSEYENESNGKIQITRHNPKPDSEEEEWAQKYGIEAAGLPTGEKVYFGLVAIAADQEQVIPMLDPSREEQLEYDVTQMISRVQRAQKHKIGIISGLPIFGGSPMMGQPGGMQPWIFISELRKTYNVVEINPAATSIDGDVNLLIILHPKAIDDALLYAIDQYVLGGGNVMAFVDPFSVTDSGAAGGGSNASELKKLLTAWGLEMDMGKVVVDYDFATKLRSGNNQVEDNPMWLSIPKPAFNAKETTTAELDNMLLPVAGAISKAAGSAYEYEPLIQSSQNAMLMESFRARFGGAEGLRRDFKASVETYDLAVRVRGSFKSAFPDGKPKTEEKPGAAPGADKTDKPHLKEATAGATIIVVSDADLLFDNYYVSNQNFLGFKISRMFNDNLIFVQNQSELLTGSDALISIRSRGSFEQPFTRVKELEKKAQSQWLAREQELMRKVEETNQKLREMEKQKDPSQNMIVSSQQESEIKQFQEEKRRISKELKEVRRNLRADIESLGNTLKFINIFLMVFVVAGAGLFYGIYNNRKVRH